MSHRIRSGTWRFALIVASIAAAIAGCAGDANNRYTPSAETAADCLQAALAAWRDGTSADELASRQPAVRVIDTVRAPSRKLREFEVLSSARASAAGWNYVVRLTFDAPAATERARFVVVGVDPIWVFRKEDYDHLAHWEHPMPETTPSAAQSGKAGPDSGANRPVSAAAPDRGDDT